MDIHGAAPPHLFAAFRYAPGFLERRANRCRRPGFRRLGGRGEHPIQARGRPHGLHADRRRPRDHHQRRPGFRVSRRYGRRGVPRPGLCEHAAVGPRHGPIQLPASRRRHLPQCLRDGTELFLAGRRGVCGRAARDRACAGAQAPLRRRRQPPADIRGTRHWRARQRSRHRDELQRRLPEFSLVCQQLPDHADGAGHPRHPAHLRREHVLPHGERHLPPAERQHGARRLGCWRHRHLRRLGLEIRRHHRTDARLHDRSWPVFAHGHRLRRHHRECDRRDGQRQPHRQRGRQPAGRARRSRCHDRRPRQRHLRAGQRGRCRHREPE